MTTLFSDGFESGNFSAWTSTSAGGATMAVSSDVAHHGSYCAKGAGLDATGDYVMATKTISAVSTAYMRAYVRFTQHIADDTEIRSLIHLEASDGAQRVDLVRGAGNNSYFWRIYNWAGGTSYDGAAFTLSLNTWICLELGVTKSATVGFDKLWVDGTAYLNQTNVNNGAGTITEIRIEAYMPFANANPGIIYWDCVVVSNAYIGAETSTTLQTVTDSLSLTDALLRHKALRVSDTVGAADSTVRRDKTALFAADLVSLTDLARTDKTLTLSDFVLLVDSSFTPLRVLQALDSVGASDSSLIQKVVLINDDISLVEVAESAVVGAKKTRLFLILGDLALQLTGN